MTGTYDAQELVKKHQKEIGIEILDFPDLSYVASLDRYVPASEVPKGEKPLSISGTKFRAMMNAGDEIPEWFSHPDVIKILRVRAVVAWAAIVTSVGHLLTGRTTPLPCRRCHRRWTSGALPFSSPA